MKKIGFVDYYVSEWHANNYPVWINELQTDYTVTHAWAELDVSPIDGLTTAQWCDKFGITKCDTIDELCEKCDVIIVLAPSNPEKHLGYAKEVLKHGKPTYIDKTFAPNYGEAKEIFDLANRYNTPFFSTSALRFAEELPQLMGGNHFIITGGGSNFPEYCIHLIEMAVKLLDDDIKSTSVTCHGKQKICDVYTVNGKSASLIYAPKLPYTVACENPDGSSAYTKITSDFFKILIKDMIRFFDEKTVSFNTDETLKVMQLRDALLS